MRCHLAILAVTVTAFVAACATPPTQHDVLVFTGRIDDKAEIDSRAKSPGAYQPGMGGALGGLAAAIMMSAAGTPAYNLYVFKLPGGYEVKLPSKLEFAPGTCIDAFTDKAHANDRFWALEEVTLRPSNACNTAP